MLRQQKVWCVVALALSASGCGGVYAIKRIDPSKPAEITEVKGVPFFVKTAVCATETIYNEPIFHVVVEEKSGEVTRVIGEALVNADAKAELATLRSLFTQAGPPKLADVVKQMAEVNKHAFDPIGGLPAAGAQTKWALLSHSTQIRVFVDYSQVYYMNVRKPWIGSVNATTELASDGTLSKTTAEVEDKTAETVLGMLPVKDVLQAVATKAFKVGDDGKIMTAEDGKPIQTPALLTLTIEAQAVKHTFTATTAVASSKSGLATTECGIQNPIEPGISNAAAYKRELPGAKKEDEKKDNEITVNGTVTLPKSTPDKK